jgi:beta-ribofuranosylaminobenzene 5'-phosphate synthase
MAPWKICLCIPHHIKALTEAEEREFFTKTVPISKEAVQSILYECIYGVTSAAAERNEGVFWLAVARIQELEWKRQEWAIYGEELKNLKLLIQECGGLSIGMSSLGPSLYFTGQDVSAVIARCSNLEPRCGWMVASTGNSGRQFTYG